MSKIKEVFSSFSVNDLAKAKQFYTDLGLKVEEGKMGLILHMVGGGTVFVYPKDDHQAASFTVLNIEVEDISTEVAKLTKNGIRFELYEGLGQDDQGIARGKATNHGPDIAWFKDPAGNIISILER